MRSSEIVSPHEKRKWEDVLASGRLKEVRRDGGEKEKVLLARGGEDLGLIPAEAVVWRWRHGPWSRAVQCSLGSV